MRTFLILVFSLPILLISKDYNQYFAFDEIDFKESFVVSNKAEAVIFSNKNNTESLNFFKNQLSFDDETPPDEDYEIIGMSPYLFSVLTTCIGGLIVSPIISGPIAILVVHIDSDKNAYARRKAFWGCFTVNMAVVAIYASIISVAIAFGYY